MKCHPTYTGLVIRLYYITAITHWATKRMGMNPPANGLPLTIIKLTLIQSMHCRHGAITGNLWLYLFVKHYTEFSGNKQCLTKWSYDQTLSEWPQFMTYISIVLPLQFPLSVVSSSLRISRNIINNI